MRGLGPCTYVKVGVGVRRLLKMIHLQHLDVMQTSKRFCVKQQLVHDCRNGLTNLKYRIVLGKEL